MRGRNLYIIAGCNGAGKTTASYTVLPEILHCNEFVNADEIAKGLSPFNPEGVAIEAGRIMLERIDELLRCNKTFAIETTLSTKSYVHLVKKAQEKLYTVHLLFFWLESPELAIQRVAKRVKSGGHNIPQDTIIRRYSAGIKNLFNLYMDSVDYWILADNSNSIRKVVARGRKNRDSEIFDYTLFNTIKGYVR